MSSRTVSLPDAEGLLEDLREILREEHPDGARIEITGRQRNVYASTFGSEVVAVRLEDGSELSLLCKYSAGREHDEHGHRGGVAYEADVYRNVLAPSPLSSPRFFGSRARTGRSGDCLVVEYLDGCWRINRAPVPDGIHAAARWIGEFHSFHDGEPRRSGLSFLTRYDAAYYAGWAQRAVEFAAGDGENLSLLGAVRAGAEQWAGRLLAIEQTVIHGEYTMQNVLFRDGTIYPVDWESAAVAPGVIDLIALVDGWPEDIVDECVELYQRARWRDGPPVDLRERLAAARLYWALRWLGSEEVWSLERECSRDEKHRVLSEYYGEVREAARQLQLIRTETRDR